MRRAVRGVANFVTLLGVAIALSVIFITLVIDNRSIHGWAALQSIEFNYIPMYF